MLRLTLDEIVERLIENGNVLKFSEDEGVTCPVLGTLTCDENDSEGLLYAKVRAFHDLTNKNRSHIETSVLEKRLSTIKDRPIMADIVERTDENGEPIKDFNGHTVVEDEAGTLTYIEKPVGHFVDPEGAHLEYDEEYDRNFVVARCVIYEEYTDACEIIRRRKTVECSVELVIREMAWDAENKILVLLDFYIQGCTLLGEGVKPGMPGSRLELEEPEPQRKELGQMAKTKNDLEKQEVETPVFSNTENEPDVSTENVGETPTIDEPDVKPEEKYVRTYELSHDDILRGLYRLLDEQYPDEDFGIWIIDVYDEYVIYSKHSYGDGNHKFEAWDYVREENDTIKLDGVPYPVYPYYLTDKERIQIDQLRTENSQLKEELRAYKEEEDFVDKMEVFTDPSYEQFLKTKEFKALMERDFVLSHSKQEIVNQADMAYGRLMKKSSTNHTKVFSGETTTHAPAPKNVRFGEHGGEGSFLEGLLQRAKNNQ